MLLSQSSSCGTAFEGTLRVDLKHKFPSFLNNMVEMETTIKKMQVKILLFLPLCDRN